MKVDVWTNVFYVISGVIIFSQSWLVGSCFILLGLASGYSHYTKNYSIDWFAMFLAYGSVIIYFLSLKHDWIGVLNKVVLTLLIAFNGFIVSRCVKGKKVAGMGYEYLLVGLFFMVGLILSFWYCSVYQSLGYGLIYLVAYIIRSKKTNYSHGVWHMLTGLGIMMLI